jgi:hypothetical protein
LILHLVFCVTSSFPFSFLSCFLTCWPDMQCGIDLVALRPSLLGAWASSSFPLSSLKECPQPLCPSSCSCRRPRSSGRGQSPGLRHPRRPSLHRRCTCPPPGVSFVLSLPEEGRRQTADRTQLNPGARLRCSQRAGRRRGAG